MKLSRTSGVAMAAAAAGLLLSGAVIAPTASAQSGDVKCAGINACKGQSACKTASSECKGKNTCKGHGFVVTTKSDCDAKGGKVIS